MIDYTYIGAVVFLVCILSGLIISTSEISMKKKMAILAMFVGISIFSFRSINEFKGYPSILNKSMEDALILGHFPEKDKGVLHIWVLERGAASPKTYTVPYDKNLRKQLDGERTKNKGQPYRIDIKTTTNQKNPLKKVVEKVEITKKGNGIGGITKSDE